MYRLFGRKIHVCRTIDEMRKVRAGLNLKVGFVPTMGGLHAGHLSLVEEAKKDCERVIASVFVNPTQFSSKDTDGGEAKYPRQLDQDVEMLKQKGVDYVFAPESVEMYPNQERKHVNLAAIGFEKTPEGICRPEFFSGVATIVAKLFNIVQPHHAYFGQKDAIQCVLIQALIRDLNYDIQFHIGETLREPNGLAMSTRNQYLSPEERESAAVVFRGLVAAKQKLLSLGYGQSIPADSLRQVVRDIYLTEPRITEIQYISIASIEDMTELNTVSRETGALVSTAVLFDLCRPDNCPEKLLSGRWKSMAQVPVAKLGALFIRTVAKPIAKGIKTQAKSSELLMNFCHSIGQVQNKLSLRVHMASRRTSVKHYTIKPLPSDQAIDKGADFLGEIFIFTVAATIATLEYQRSVEKSIFDKAANLAKENEQKQEVEDRFRMLEERVEELEKRSTGIKIPKLG